MNIENGSKLNDEKIEEKRKILMKIRSDDLCELSFEIDKYFSNDSKIEYLSDFLLKYYDYHIDHQDQLLSYNFSIIKNILSLISLYNFDMELFDEFY